MSGFRVGLVIPNEITRVGLYTVLVKRADVAEVIPFQSADELAHLDQCQPFDLLLLDITGDSGRDIAIPQNVQTDYRVIVIDQLHIRFIRQLIKQGMNGIIFSGDDLSKSVQEALDRAVRGIVYMSPKVVEIMSTGSLILQDMGEREREVLRLIAEGCTVKAIAKALHVSTKTIYRDRDRLREALNVQTNEQIVDEARRQGLL